MALPFAPALAALLVAAAPAAAPAPSAPSEGPDDTHSTAESEAAPEAPETRRFIVAAKIVAGTSRAAGSTTPLFGPGLDAELELWPHGLELELAAAALLGDGLTSIPTELLLKKAFHVGETMDLFVAAGGILNFVIHDDHDDAIHPGGIALAGAYLWHTPHFGLLVEMSYAILSAEDMVEHDLEGGVGIAYRF